MNQLAGSPQNDFEDNGFDYEDGNGNNGQNAFEDPAMGGGFGDAMGLDEGDNLLAMEEELNNAGGNRDGSAQDTFEVTFSITFDEDDDNKFNLNLAELF